MRATVFLRTVDLDLSNADPSSHHLAVELSIGDYQASHTRKWILRNGKLIGR